MCACSACVFLCVGLWLTCEGPHLISAPETELDQHTWRAPAILNEETGACY